MSDQTENIVGFRSEVVATHIAQAALDEDFRSVYEIFANESANALARELVVSLSIYVASLARMAAEQDPDPAITADSILAGLRNRAEMAMIACGEIDLMTNPDPEREDDDQ